MYHTCLGKEERVCRFLPVVNAGPDDFEAPLRFELYDANFQLLEQDNCCRGARVRR